MPIQGQAEVTGEIRQLLPDPKNACTVAVSALSKSYYVITTMRRPAVRKVGVPVVTFAGVVTNGRLYLLCRNPSTLDILDTLSGKTERSIDLKGMNADSVASFPSRGVVYVADREAQKVRRIDLESGAVTDVNLSGWCVASDPAERYLFVTGSTTAGGMRVPRVP